MTDNALKIIKDELARMIEAAKPCDGEFTNDSYYKTQLDLATKALSVAVSKLGETYPGEYGAIFKASNDEAITTIANILSGGKSREHYTSQRDDK